MPIIFPSTLRALQTQSAWRVFKSEALSQTSFS
jgi:hypothetical protein